MPHDVFISHSTAGRLTAYAICSELEALGIRCWILPRDLKAGTGWDQSIADAVASCRVMIVVFSEYGSRSDRVERQLELAFTQGIIVVPFRTEPDPSGLEPPLSEPVHWIDAMTPETAKRLGGLCDLMRGLIVPQKHELWPVKAPARGPEPSRSTGDENLSEISPILEGLRRPAVAAPSGGPGAKEAPPVSKPILESESPEKSGRAPQKASKWLAVRALLLVLVPFAIICGVGVWQAEKGNRQRLMLSLPATASPVPPVAAKTQHQDKFGASDPGWGTLDANWRITEGKLQVKPLLNSSAVLINHRRGFTDADITAELTMVTGEDLDQLGGLIFWAKDYNDCYALVISADGKFAVGRKLVGRWINPIAKTGNPAIKTGVGQTNRLHIRTEGNLVTAFINDIQIANLVGEPPQGLSYIGLYGESAETTQNVWDFTNVTVFSGH